MIRCVLAAAAAILLFPGLAVAGDEPPVTVGPNRAVVGIDRTAGQPSSPGSTPASTTSTCSYRGSPVACGTGSNWSSAYGCYLHRSDFQDGVPSSHTAYNCLTPTGQVRVVYLPVGAAPPTGPDPAVLARQVVFSIPTRGIEIGIVPEPGDNRMGLVGLPTWMWVADPGPNTTGPVSDSAQVGATAVSATGRVTSITWNMGDGTTVPCDPPGTPYTDAAGSSDSPDCGHHYVESSRDEAGNKYRVTATTHWEFNWQGSGQSGTITFTQESSTSVRVGELQVLVERG